MKGFTNSKFKTKASSGAEETISRKKQTLSCASVRCKIQVQTLSSWKLCITSEPPKSEHVLKPSGERSCSLLLPLCSRGKGASKITRLSTEIRIRFQLGGFGDLGVFVFFKKKNWVDIADNFRINWSFFSITHLILP